MLKSDRAQLLALLPDSCIESRLLRYSDRNGCIYARLWYCGRYITIPAHRVIYSLFVSLALSGDPVRHTCGNPSCLNPKHLLSDSDELAVRAVSSAIDQRDSLADSAGGVKP